MAARFDKTTVPWRVLAVVALVLVAAYLFATAISPVHSWHAEPHSGGLGSGGTGLGGTSVDRGGLRVSGGNVSVLRVMLGAGCLLAAWLVWQSRSQGLRGDGHPGPGD